jgi:hypothetical protein
MAAPIEITTADDATKLGIRTALGAAPIASPTFTGTATATTFSGSGASLTSLPSANLSGLVPIANLANTQTVGNAGVTIANGTRAVILNAAITSPVIYILPRADSYLSGTGLVFCDTVNGVGPFPAGATFSPAMASSDTINGSSGLILVTPGIIAMFVSDGVSKWKVQTDIAGTSIGSKTTTSVTTPNLASTTYLSLTGNSTNGGVLQGYGSAYDFVLCNRTGGLLIGGGNSGGTTVDILNALNVINDLRLGKTITATGTTGAQTISKPSGSVNFAAGATSLVVTNTRCTTSSVILLTVGTNDTTMKSATAVAAAGSFTILTNVAPTAETRVNFILTN